MDALRDAAERGDARAIVRHFEAAVALHLDVADLRLQLDTSRGFESLTQHFRAIMTRDLYTSLTATIRGKCATPRLHIVADIDGTLLVPSRDQEGRFAPGQLYPGARALVALSQPHVTLCTAAPRAIELERHTRLYELLQHPLHIMSSSLPLWTALQYVAEISLVGVAPARRKAIYTALAVEKVRQIETLRDVYPELTPLIFVGDTTFYDALTANLLLAAHVVDAAFIQRHYRADGRELHYDTAHLVETAYASRDLLYVRTLDEVVEHVRRRYHV